MLTEFQDKSLVSISNVTAFPYTLNPIPTKSAGNNHGLLDN